MTTAAVPFALPLTEARQRPEKRRLPQLPVAALLDAQRTMTAVERFAKQHDAGDVPAQAKYYRDLIPLERPRPNEQYAFEVDLDACTGCKACVSACHTLNGLDETEIWRTVGLLHGGTSQSPAVQTVTTACHHCVEPACLSGCPVQAYEKDPITGNVKHLDDQCIGCQYCTLMCPYDAPKYNKALGIRPRDELARAAGIGCHARGGIIVDDRLRTSDAHVYAIGECACHDNMVYGLVGPGYSMAQTLARQISGDDIAVFSGADTSTQLKLLGVDVASFGDPFADERTRQSVVLQNFVNGVYQKLTLSEDGSRLLGGILVGDASRYSSLISLQRSGRELSTRAEALLVEGIASGGAACANDDDLVCTCNSVSRGTIIEAVRGKGCLSFGDVKAKTRAGTGCGGCASAGEITPEKLLVIAQVAQKYGLYTKITGAQRIDMFGATLSQLPAIWEELVAAGFESGHAYGKALRTVKSCVGSTWCRFGVNDSVGFAIRVENRYKGIRAPHKLKSAVSGCIRECAEAQSKDFGLIATENGWNVYVCGNGGAQPRHADLLATGVDDEMAIKLIDRFLMYYIRTADRLTRTSKWMDQMEGGIAHLKDVIINDSLGICADLERDVQHLVDTYQCEWAEVVHNPKLREKFREHVNDNDIPPLMVPVRGQAQPASWPKGEALPSRRRLPLVQSSWVPLAKAAEFPKDTGVTYRFGRAQIAVFHISQQNRWYATQAACPHKGDAVLGRGILGDSCGTAKVACPFHKRTFSLETGQCTSGEGVDIITFPVRVEDGVVQVELPGIQELETLLTSDLPPCEEHTNKVSTAAE